MTADELILEALGLLHQDSDFAGGTARLRYAIDRADAAGDETAAGEARVFLAEVLFQHRTGLDEARQLAEAALRIASRSDTKTDRIAAWRLSASELLLALGPEQQT